MEVRMHTIPGFSPSSLFIQKILSQTDNPFSPIQPILLEKPMPEYEITLTKAYTVKIEAENEESAKRLSEFYTGDIKDISTLHDRKTHRFKILEIGCTVNEGS
jgi:hypothetical protein